MNEVVRMVGGAPAGAVGNDMTFVGCQCELPAMCRISFEGFEISCGGADLTMGRRLAVRNINGLREHRAGKAIQFRAFQSGGDCHLRSVGSCQPTLQMPASIGPCGVVSKRETELK